MGNPLLKVIKPGDSVTIVTPQGQQRTGRAVMRSSHGGWVLNMGGKHGTPGVADEHNIVSVKVKGGRSGLGNGKRQRREHVSLIIKGPKKSAQREGARYGVPMASCVTHGKDVQCFTACTPSTRDRLDEWFRASRGGRNRSTQRTWSSPGSLLYVGGSCLSALGSARTYRKRRR
jgi:hypothetical protein